MNEVTQYKHNKSVLKSDIIESNMTAQNTSVPPSESEMCLRWNSHHSNMQTIFPTLLQNERYVDVTLAADGQLIKCHKLVLSSCSDYFDEILKDTYPMQHTVIYLRGIPFWIIKALVDFMYKGEVNIDQIKLEPLLKAAEDLLIKGLAGKAKVKQEPEDTPMIPEQKQPKETHEKRMPEQKQPKEVHEKRMLEQKQLKEVYEKRILEQKQPKEVHEKKAQSKETYEKLIKKEIEKEYGGGMDDDDDDYTPNQYYKRKLQPKKIRKRKIATPPDPSALKHVKINLKGTKSRPNIKQPKFYDPDYPEYNPDRCVSPPKLDSNDPIFNIDSIKMEPIDFEVPTSPSYSEISSLMDQSLSECASLEEKLKTEKNKSLEMKTAEEPKKIRKYVGKSSKPNFTQDKQAIFQTACSSIDIPPATIIKKIEQDTSDVNVDAIIEHVVSDSASNQNAFSLNVLNKNMDNTSFKKVIDIKKPQSTSEVEKPTISQMRVRNLPTTDHVLKKFASTHLTSILKKDSMPVILRRVSSPKPAILRHSTPKKIEIVKADSPDIAEKLSALAKTKKELTSVDASNVSQTSAETSVKQLEIKSQNINTENLSEDEN